eukprot:gene1806-948_t
MSSNKNSTESYSNVVGGKLKLKGSAGSVKKIEKKKKTQVITENIKKTESQLAFEEARLKKKKEGKLKTKTYQEKVEEFNEKMDKKTEHNDIPKVGPG